MGVTPRLASSFWRICLSKGRPRVGLLGRVAGCGSLAMPEAAFLLNCIAPPCSARWIGFVVRGADHFSATSPASRQFCSSTSPLQQQDTDVRLSTDGGDVENASWPDLPIFRAGLAHSQALAIRHIDNEQQFSYGQLLRLSAQLCELVRPHVDSANLNQSNDHANVLCGSRVALLLPASVEFVCGVLAVWALNGVAVPLHSSLAVPQMKFMIEDAQAALVLVHPALMESHGRHLQKELKHTRFVQMQVHQSETTSGTGSTNGNDTRRAARPTPASKPTTSPSSATFRGVSLSQLAALIYSSGTTGRPKGVAYTHSMFVSQINSQVLAWKWQSTDSILHCLPLHHVHGLVNALLCPLSVGAAVHFLKKFEATTVLSQWLEHGVFSVFTAVPTIYQKLVSAFDALPTQAQARVSARLRSFRLMMCGSAALPEPLFERWLQISGQRLLERYGSTECGMVLANVYEPQHRRKMGAVGQPLPNVQVKVNAMHDTHTDTAAAAQTHTLHSGSSASATVTITVSTNSGVPFGELCVGGTSVFPFYWRRADATAAAFDSEGYFLTGDIVRVDSDGDYRIVGRASVDIIKSGGNKLSALEIESVLLQHPQISECAVLGWPDQQFGEVVCLVAVPTAALNAANTHTQTPDAAAQPNTVRPWCGIGIGDGSGGGSSSSSSNSSRSSSISNGSSGGGSGSSLVSVQNWCRGRLSNAEIPRRLYLLETLPRNALGKVNKKELRELLKNVEPIIN